MKKFLAIVLAVAMIFSMSAIAFADDAAADTTASTSGIQAILDQIVSTVSSMDIVANLINTVKSLAAQIMNLLGAGSGESAVLGAVSDLEAKIGDLGIIGDVLEYIENLITNVKQKIKDLYAGNKETTIVEEETTAAAAPAETGSTSIGLVAFAAASVAAAAAYVCTKKKED